MTFQFECARQKRNSGSLHVFAPEDAFLTFGNRC
jgi:hypothetical protein